MTTVHVEIDGGDYCGSGKGSKLVKEGLRKLGVAPTAMRRAIVALYEAEMNVAIHAHHGELHAVFTPEALEVIVDDCGPGIPDIEQAMREGYSTAPPEARELGFGAGMGLPNIRRNADRFSIRSIPGKGTTLRFSVFLTQEHAEQSRATALHVQPDACIRCLRCLNACPTQAIRLRAAGPEVLRHLCVDCTSCMDVCPQGVFDLECSSSDEVSRENSLLVVQSALLGQFRGLINQDDFKILWAGTGWKDVLFTGGVERQLRQASMEYASENDPGKLRLSPVCPAVLNLIQLRYPSLIQYVIPFLSPFEMVRDCQVEGQMVFVPACPAQAALVNYSDGLTSRAVLHPHVLLREMRSLTRSNAFSPTGESDNSHQQVTVVAGMRRVVQFLEKAERGLAEDSGLLELYACDDGCYGSPVWDTPPALARMHSSAGEAGETEYIIPVLFRLKSLEQRAGERLDADMAKAIRKLAAIDRLSKQLPGRDCGVCGAPTCLTFAEDSIMGRADVESCIFADTEKMQTFKAVKENDL